MEQKTAKVTKRKMWSVLIHVERDVQEGRIVTRRKRLTDMRQARYIPGPVVTVLHEFLYLGVTKMFKKKGILYIQVGTGKKKELHHHEVKSINSIQIREYKRDGRIE
jgi:hypothetical protein